MRYYPGSKPWFRRLFLVDRHHYDERLFGINMVGHRGSAILAMVAVHHAFTERPGSF
jgi:hypothetical protein